MCSTSRFTNLFNKISSQGLQMTQPYSAPCKQGLETRTVRSMLSKRYLKVNASFGPLGCRHGHDTTRATTTTTPTCSFSSGPPPGPLPYGPSPLPPLPPLAPGPYRPWCACAAVGRCFALCCGPQFPRTPRGAGVGLCR